MIKLLPQSLINKIAAGEVVERPASVVKELMENALDAGASEIAVEIEGGGKRLIAVRDNGSGMNKEDLALSIRPYATSKITSIEDLFTIATFGFRGEALSSVASVSELRIISREKGAGAGYELAAGENGKGSIVQPIGATVGTSVTCKNLFSNVPARQKFLKSDTTEFAHILETFLQYALINYGVAFTLVHNKRALHRLSPAPKWDARIADVLGKNFLQTALPVRFETRDFRISGFVVSPHEAREKSKQYVFINKRPVRDFLIAKAVRSGYGNLIMGRESPSFILDVWINPGRVDVNVHPRKLEVKHENPGEVFGFIERAVGRELSSAPNVLKGGETSILDENVVARGFTSTPAPRNFPPSAYTAYKRRPSFAAPRVGETFTGGAGQIHDAPRLYDTSASKTTPLGRLIGQLHNSYILIEAAQGLVLIDQHAASERINYERLIAQLNAHSQIEKQALLVPLTVEVSLNERQALETSSEILGSFGFDIAPLGGNTFALHTTPADLKVHNPQELLKDILADLLEEAGSALSLEDKKKKMLAVVSCRSAIKFGDPLTDGEQRALLETLAHTPNNVSCIHGRPVFYTITTDELARWFKRR